MFVCWHCHNPNPTVVRINTPKNGEQNICKKCWEIYYLGVPVIPEKCPQCQKNLKIKLNMRTCQKFLGCSGYPTCSFTRKMSES